MTRILRDVLTGVAGSAVWEAISKGVEEIYEKIIDEEEKPSGDKEKNREEDSPKNPEIISTFMPDVVGHHGEKILNHPELRPLLEKYQYVLVGNGRRLDDPFNREGQAFMRDFEPKLKQILIPRVHYTLRTKGVISENTPLPYQPLNGLFSGR